MNVVMHLDIKLEVQITMPMDGWEKKISNCNRKDLAMIQINWRNKACLKKVKVRIYT